MATTNEQINIKLQLDAAEAEAIALRVKKTLEDAAVAATRIKITPAYEGANVARSSSGRFVGRKELEDRAAAEAAGTTYVKPVKRSSAMAAAQAPPPISQRTVSDSSLSRSVAGQTGSDSRDFAKQAQGLGGLVHVYATFAANAFAASAAFTALSKAADTSNMIIGLQQLSASGGVSLTALAKQMVSVSDGAISLRQAMSSTALAASSGMTSSQILKMTEIAKKASLALGRDMTDSMDRLTKGIVKVQPELLDELGIMARVIPSQQAYARSVGKSVDALTQYEKQLAFTQAVLAEGTRKFNDIDIDSNSFSKLSAALDNVVFSGLRSINVVLEPIIKLLSASPTGLSAVLAGIAAVLLKQAIPALGQFREGAEKANALSLTRVSALFLNNAQKLGQNDDKIADNAKAERQKYETSKAYIDLLAVDKEKALKQANAVEKKYVDERKIITGGFASHEQILERGRASALAAAAKNARKISVQETAEQFGSIAAYRKMNEEILNSKTMGTSVLNGLKEADGSPSKSVAAKTNAIGNAFERVGLIAGIAGGGIMRLVGSLGTYGQIAAVVIATGSFIISFFKNATQEAEEFSRAVDYSNDTLKTYDTVVKKFSKQSAFNKNSVEQIVAYSAATLALVDATEKLVDAYDAYAKKANFVDNAVQFTIGDNKLKNLQLMLGGVVDFFNGKSFQDKLRINDGMQQDIAAKLESDLLSIGERVKGSAAQKQLQEGLSDIFNINFKNLDTSGDKYKGVIKNIEYDTLYKSKERLLTLEKKVVQSMATEAAAVKEFSSTLQTLNQDYDAFNASLTSTDPFMKLAKSTMKFGILMGNSFDEPRQKAAEFKKFIEDTSNFRLFSPELQQDLIRLNLAATKIKALEAKKEDLVDKSKNPTLTADQKLDVAGKIVKMEIDIKSAESFFNRFIDTSKVQLRLSSESMALSFKNFEASLATSRDKSTIDVSQKLLSLSQNSVEGIKLKGELDKKLIDVQNNLSDSILKNVIASYRLGLIFEKATIEQEKKTISELPAGGERDEKNKAIYDRDVINEIQQKILEGISRTTPAMMQKNLDSTDPLIQKAAQLSLPIYQETRNLNVNKQNTLDQKKIVDMQTEESIGALLVSQDQKIYEYGNKVIALRNEGLAISQKDSNYQSAAGVALKSYNEQLQKHNDFSRDTAAIKKNIEIQTSRSNEKDISTKKKDAIDKSIKNYQKELVLLADIYNLQEAISTRATDTAIADAVISKIKYAADIQLKTNTDTISYLSIQQDILSVRDSDLAFAKEQLEINNLEVTNAKELSTIILNRMTDTKNLEQRIQKQKSLALLEAKDLPPGTVENNNVEIKILKDKIAEGKLKERNIEKQEAINIVSIRARGRVDEMVAINDIKKLEMEVVIEKRKLLKEQADSNTNLKQVILTNKINLGFITEESAIQEKFELDLNTLKISHEDKLQDIHENNRKKQLEFEVTLLRVKEAVDLDLFRKRIEDENTLFNIRVEQIKLLQDMVAGKVTDLAVKVPGTFVPLKPREITASNSSAVKIVNDTIAAEKELNIIRNDTENKKFANDKEALTRNKTADEALLKRKRIIDDMAVSMNLLADISNKLNSSFGEGGAEVAKVINLFKKSQEALFEYSKESARLAILSKNETDKKIEQAARGVRLEKQKISEQQKLIAATAAIKSADEAASAASAASAAAKLKAEIAVAAEIAASKEEAARRSANPDDVTNQIAVSLARLKSQKDATTEAASAASAASAAQTDAADAVKLRLSEQLSVQSNLKDIAQKQIGLADDRNKQLETQARLTKDITILETNRFGFNKEEIADMAGMLKKNFKVESDGYKLLNNLERKANIDAQIQKGATYAYSKGLITQETAMKLGSMEDILAAAATSALRMMGLQVGPIFGSFMAALGPFGPPLASAAIAAFMGVAAGGQAAEYKPIDYEKYQKDIGQEKGTGGGSANSDTINTGIKDALDDLRSIAKPELTFTSRMVKYLEKIENNTFQASFGKGALSSPSFKDTFTGKVKNSTAVTSAPINTSVLGATAGAGAVLATPLVVSGMLAAAQATVVAGTAAAAATGAAAATIAAATATVSTATTAVTALTSFSATLAATPLLPFAAAAAVVFALVPEIGETVSDWLFGTETVYKSLAGFGVIIEEQSLEMASSNIAMSGFTDSLVQVGKSANLWEKLWGGGYSVKESIVRDSGINLEKSMKDAVQEIFSGIRDSLKDATTILSKSDPAMVENFSSISRVKRQEIDLKTGTPKEIADRVSGAMSNQADAFAESLMSGKNGTADVRQFRVGDEKSYQAYLRLAASQEQAAYYTEKLNIKTQKLSQLTNKQGDASAELVRESILLSEATTGKYGIGSIILTLTGNAGDLYKAYTDLKDIQLSMNNIGTGNKEVNADVIRGAGGIDNLKTSIANYEAAFETPAQRLVKKQAELARSFGLLGLQVPKTSKDFITLVETLGAGGPATDYLYGGVIALTDSYVSLTDATKEVTAANAAKLTNEIKIYELLGYASKALELTRQKELDTLDQDLIASQKYIYALEDEISARDKLNEVYKSTTASITNQIKSLKEYKTSLNTGASSILTPQEKYNLAKADFESTAKAASAYTDINSTPADIAKRDDAISNLSKTAETFRETSSVMFASGAQYVANVKSINTAIDDSISSLTVQETDIKKQLGFLDSISSSSKSTAQLLGEYLKLQGVSSLAKVDSVNSGSNASTYANTITKRADGGLVQGISLVGERGPEIVDFSTPGRVYSNAASNDIFSTKELVAELKALRTEVSHLRQEQKEQTGHIITSNYDANRKNADKLSEVTENAMNQQSWKERNKVMIV